MEEAALWLIMKKLLKFFLPFVIILERKLQI